LISSASLKGTVDEEFKVKSGAKSLNSPLGQVAMKGEKCFACEKKAKYWFYFGKSY